MSEPVRALLVEDSETDAKLITRILKRALGQIHTQRIETAADLREALAKHTWDVVICDWSMPHLDALAALRILGESRLDIPLIIVSGTIGEEKAVLAMRSGARDYVLKDRLARLPPTVERELREARDRQRRRQSEEALRISEARFARLAESGIVGIAIADVLGNVLEANDAYLKICGCTPEDVAAGRVRWADATPPELMALADKALVSLREHGAAAPWETEVIRKDGTRVPVMVAVAMLEHPLTIAIVTDLTERRAAERALRRTEEQLLQAQKMEAVGILAGGVAHDFNNILSIILGYCGMLLDDLPAESALRGDILEIQAAGERGAALTRRLLAFSRQQVVEMTTVDLNAVVRGIDLMLRRLIRSDIRLALGLHENLGLCRCDAGQVEQVLMNLAINAVDAMPEGGTLTVETANAELDDEYVVSHGELKPGRYVALIVSDTGMGMSKEIQARIFEPFFTTKPKGKGTGLGLSTVFGIVQQAGGSLQVYSEPGRGSTFKIYLPRMEQSAAASPASPAFALARGAETVLLVEDEERLRRITAEILKRAGFNVLQAGEGDEALAICANHSGVIDLLLTDVVMPRMNGRQLAERVREMLPGIKVLFSSGYTGGVLEGELPVGAAFLQKPFTPTALTGKIRATLDG
ncbi:MAG TPA: response regulator [Steroidobacteraceae bacterium]|nr:response regulator [Steroidobacteraceae bacterium]